MIVPVSQNENKEACRRQARYNGDLSRSVCWCFRRSEGLSTDEVLQFRQNKAPERNTSHVQRGETHTSGVEHESQDVCCDLLCVSGNVSVHRLVSNSHNAGSSGKSYEAFQASRIGRVQLVVTPINLAARSAGLFRGIPSGSKPTMKLADMMAGSEHPMISLPDGY